MKLLRLYIQNFMCFDWAYIDLTQFSAALVVGKKDSNDHYSNGVGKTSIFKAIEYVLFNEADVNLEDIILDDALYCRVVIDFMIDNQEYRLSRKRTKKGSNDLTLLERNGQDGNETEVYHTITTNIVGDNNYEPHLDKKDFGHYWKDLSGSRAADTEKDLAKLIKFTYKSFRSTVHFMQNDMTGLATVTPEKRKGILKDALSLLVYAKLEKIAKERAAKITKDIEKNQMLLDQIGDPDKELNTLVVSLTEAEKFLVEKSYELTLLNETLVLHAEKINEFTRTHTTLENKFASLLAREQVLLSDRAKSETSVKEYTTKCATLVKISKNLITEVTTLKETQTRLATADYTQIDILNEQVVQKKEDITRYNVTIKNNVEKYEDLKIPLPSGSICKNCRKPMTDAERKDCQKHINEDMKTLQDGIQEAKKAVIKLNIEINEHQTVINTLNRSKQQLESINTQIVSWNKDIQDKRSLYGEYAGLLEKFKKELQEKNNDFTFLQEELKNSSIEEANNVKLQIEEEKKKIQFLNPRASLLNKEITHYNSNKAVIQHSINQKTQDKLKKITLKETLEKLEKRLIRFPSVIQGFSSTGIPNLIIQDVLDDLQIEANKLLILLRPEMQLSFLVEKTTGDGEQADTLDIKYIVNGKKRYYEQLSGAMRLAVIFSLKLGLSSVLQNRLGMDIKFLLLDEIDQSLDKASVDAFADIVKFFQNDFTVLVVTHNDRLKDKFSHAILVEQDMNMVSRAKVVSSW